MNAVEVSHSTRLIVVGPRYVTDKHQAVLKYLLYTLLHERKHLHLAVRWLWAVIKVMDCLEKGSPFWSLLTTVSCHTTIHALVIASSFEIVRLDQFAVFFEDMRAHSKVGGLAVGLLARRNLAVHKGAAT